MIDFVLGSLALITGGLGYALHAADRAPLGYEDEQGFHFGQREPEMAPEECLEVVPEPAR